MDSKTNGDDMTREISSFILNYISEMSDLPADISKLENFIDNGLLDSFEIINLVVTIERRFGVKLSANEVSSEDFKTVSGLTNTVLKKHVDS